ncbi:MAG: hypothetical protein ACJ75S_12660 [Solirubrobacterales bacterium]
MAPQIDLLRRRPEFFVFLGTLVLSFIAIAVFEAGRVPGNDGSQYLLMAEDPGAQVAAPYVTRVLGPLVVWALPTGPSAGFWILTAASFATAATLLFSLLEDMTGSKRRALGGVAVFLAAASTPNLRNPYLLDAFSYCLLLGVILMAVRQRWWSLVLLMPLALLTRDPLIVLAAPAVLILAIGRREAWLPLAVTAAVTVGVWLLLNKTSLVLGFVPTHKEDYFSAEQIHHVLRYERRYGSLSKVAVSSVIFSFGAVWLAPLISRSAIWRNKAARATAASGVVAILLAPFITDWIRALGYAFPLIITAVALLPRGDQLHGTLALAMCVAAMNFGIQPMLTGGAKYLLEATALLLEIIILFTLSRRPNTDLAAFNLPARRLRSG